MNLADKLLQINKPKIPLLKDGKARTIEDFYNSFIEPLLPQNITRVIVWHNILKDYVKKMDVILGFRAGNQRGRLRRGWETTTNDHYSFFYTDNFFAHYFYKLALDSDYEVNPEEFYKLMVSKKFPVRFKYYMGTEKDPYEKEYASFIIDGKNPGINTSGYKLAHVIDAGQNYYVDGRSRGLAEIIDKYFPLGIERDWCDPLDSERHCRKLLIKAEDKKIARKYAEISFLRMVHPMNYFLSPKSPNNGNIYNKYYINQYEKNNIAEDKNLISYVRKRFHERYTFNGKDYFQEFLDLVYPEIDKVQENGKTLIDIEYSRNPLNIKLPKKQHEFFEFLSREVQAETAKQDGLNKGIMSSRKEKRPQNSEGQVAHNIVIDYAADKFVSTPRKEFFINNHQCSSKEFEAALRGKHSCVQRTLYYVDNSSKQDVWNVSNFQETSNIHGNLSTGPLRNWRKKGIVGIKLELNM